MAEFPLKIKKEAKDRSAYKCCICHDNPGTEVHHITPPGEGGTNKIDNTVPMCAGCHDKLGNDSTKRLHIRWARDYWWERVKEKYTPKMRDEIRIMAEKAAEEKTDEKLEPYKQRLNQMWAILISKVPGDSLSTIASAFYSLADYDPSFFGEAGTIIAPPPKDLPPLTGDDIFEMPEED